ncbi:MAG: endolytic transglycosylase MltG [Armatimonadota bacterium]|nr:endolytic transglycosylase MltG [Armatimonadota bacterium]MCX7778424.1 endolytic transglycosylase MltG [Armatimonadota bacterium]MDW8025769.1 endolytic transglycosylase MltG [Armatimonadota bacterium]
MGAKISRRFATLLILIALATLFSFAAMLSIWLFKPINIGRGKSIRVHLGATVEDVINEMASIKMHRPVWLLKICIHALGINRRLKAGWYDLKERSSRFGVLMALREGNPRLAYVLIPPGLMAHEIAARLEGLGLVDAKRFVNLVENPQNELRRPWLPEGKPLEGFLFPETYCFPPLHPGKDEAYAIEVMLKEFERQFIKPHESELEALGNSLYEVVTIASMVELEAKVDEERPIIAGVLLNRLRLKMPLQCDATIFYALKQRKRRITYSDLRINSPYNTYKHKGLPPTPICNPGLKSLRAALKPANVDFLYYVARGDGRHNFSRTYQEHLEAVKQWRRIQRQILERESTTGSE